MHETNSINRHSSKNLSQKCNTPIPGVILSHCVVHCYILYISRNACNGMYTLHIRVVLRCNSIQFTTIMAKHPSSTSFYLYNLFGINNRTDN